MVGLGRLELPTSPLSGVRSNQLSYRPISLASTSEASMFGLLQIRHHAICVNTREISSEEKASTNTVLLQDKEVIQPQVPLGLPCYDFTPVMNHKVVTVLPKVRLATSFATHSHGVTGGVYKARERIHRGILIHDY
jgi:hypothetical protein